MTWFDALLITLLGMLGALGLRHGFSALVWGGLCLLAAYFANRLSASLDLWATLGLALGLGTGASLLAGLIQSLTSWPYRTPPLWASAAGLLGSTGLGLAVAAAFALSFPLSPKVDAAGVRYVYPSPEMQPALHQAVDHSMFKRTLMPLWEQQSGWQTLLLPDLPVFKGNSRP
ncbi:hypothetical protein GCM10017783_24110 [Deinococcus piscis]|uniref:Colicin V production protein n=1 Tax=Deinococcus piscis TaxID=394230 RepID=A0ABQ3KD91_9DEIO|nr:hypothetical protein [Deinococcus piscis]GHG10883.1 hypothetical protein GCM10017783_24110 [Deinococcus piscis]